MEGRVNHLRLPDAVCVCECVYEYDDHQGHSYLMSEVVLESSTAADSAAAAAMRERPVWKTPNCSIWNSNENIYYRCASSDHRQWIIDQSNAWFAPILKRKINRWNLQESPQQFEKCNRRIIDFINKLIQNNHVRSRMFLMYWLQSHWDNTQP